MPTEKLFDFLVSQEFYQLIDKTDEFLKIDPKVDGEKDSKVTFFLDRYFRERLSGTKLQNYAKQILDFLSDEEIDNLLNFINENFSNLREKLWQEEITTQEQEEIDTQEIEKIKPVTFEEKTKKYQEIMESLIKKKEKNEEKPKPIEKEFKTITFEPQEIHQPQETFSQEDLSETAIIIKKKKSEDQTKDTDGELDLSKLYYN
jgi:hypothetical protein